MSSPRLLEPAAPFCRLFTRTEEIPMTLTVAHVTPLVALIAGILILIMPRLLKIVAIYLIFIGLVGLNDIHHFFR
jgi:Protein of unknown function (DUF3096)